MSACRETMNIWWWMRTHGIKKTWKRKIWKQQYFFHDSFGRHWHRFIYCSHSFMEIELETGERGLYCFWCERPLKEILRKAEIKCNRCWNLMKKKGKGLYKCPMCDNEIIIQSGMKRVDKEMEQETEDIKRGT